MDNTEYAYIERYKACEHSSKSWDVRKQEETGGNFYEFYEDFFEQLKMSTIP